MTDSIEDSPLISSVQWHDESSREERADRIAWASLLYRSTGIVVGEILPLSLMEEARSCFVNGQFMACLLCATSVVEHLLVEELKSRKLVGGAESKKPKNKKLTLGSSIKIAEDCKDLFEVAVLDRLNRLNDLRNPIAHRREIQDGSTLSNRYIKQKKHPKTILENDARFALEVMYEIFKLLLK